MSELDAAPLKKAASMITLRHQAWAIATATPPGATASQPTAPTVATKAAVAA